MRAAQIEDLPFSPTTPVTLRAFLPFFFQGSQHAQEKRR